MIWSMLKLAARSVGGTFAGRSVGARGQFTVCSGGAFHFPVWAADLGA